MNEIQTQDSLLKQFKAVDGPAKYGIADFTRYLERKNLPLQVDSVQSYIESIKGIAKANTVNSRLSHIKKRLRAICPDWQRAKLETELRDIKGVKVNKSELQIGEDKMVSEAEYQKFLRSTRPEKPVKLIVEALWMTGCRISELLNARLDHANIQPECVFLTVTGKGTKQRTVYLSHGLYERLTAYFRGSTYLIEHTGKPYHRCYISQRVGRLSLKILKRRLHPHMFRHSFASRTIVNTGDIYGVSTYLGHSDITTTARFYCHSKLRPQQVLQPELVRTA